MQRILIIAGLSPPFLIMLALAVYGPTPSQAIVALIAIVAAGAFFWPWERQNEFNANPRLAPQTVVPIPDDTLDLAGVRLAIAARSHPAIARHAMPMRGANEEQVRALLQALLDVEEAWVFASLESTPRRPEAQIQAAATRLMDDAKERFPLPSTEPIGPEGDPFRSGADGVFVLSLVVTSRHSIKGHRADSKQQTRALLRHLRELAAEAHTLDVSVSTFLSIDDVTKRDPAMRGIA